MEIEFTVYPEEDWNSWISIWDADEYFRTRISSEVWGKLDYTDQEASLYTAFRSLSELPLDLTDLERGDAAKEASLLKILGQAQCEQAQHELTRDLDSQQARSVSLAGLLSVTFPEKKESDRYSSRALAYLRSYLSIPSVKRFR